MEGKTTELEAANFIKELVKKSASAGWDLDRKLDIVYTRPDTSFWFDLVVKGRKHRVHIPEQYVDTKSYDQTIRHIEQQLLRG